jgi:hypothetical protein
VHPNNRKIQVRILANINVRDPSKERNGHLYYKKLITGWHVKSFHCLCLTVFREMARETKSPGPICRKQEFYDASRLRGDKF